MNHAITVGEVVTTLLIIGGVVAVLTILVLLVTVFNPFRSGH